MARIMVAAKSAIFDHDGRRVIIRKGVHTAREGHSIVKEHPDLWEPQTVTYDSETDEKATPVQEEPKTAPKPAETATAAPGEKRTVGTSAQPTRRGRRSGTKNDGKEDGE